MPAMEPTNLEDCREPEGRRTLRGQFALPTGWLGSLAGHMMALKNRERSRFVRAQLDLEPEHRVLEIGFGPGTDIAAVSDLARSVVGVDPSRAMIAQASRRNLAAMRDGRVQLRCGRATELLLADEDFDRVYAINNVQFWDPLERGVAEIRRVLRPGGRAVIAIQPRNEGATEETTAAWGERLKQALADAGFILVRAKTRDMSPVPCVCVVGLKPV